MESTAFLKELQHSHYRLLGLIGQGQFGQVYCAIHRKTGQLVALKNLNRNRLPTHRFLRELRFLLSLEHPYIVHCYALEQSATGRQLVLDYCEGGTLRSIMEQETQLMLAEILTLTTEILTALEHAHGQGIVHCDIKPENILLSLTPDGWQAKVSDFGIARLSQELVGDYNGATGSPAYMAPERFYHQYSQVSDLYAVGIILYELLLGDRPFSGSPAQLMVAHLNHTIKIPDVLPQGLQTLLHKSLEKLMARRFHNASEMKAAIAAMRQTLTAAELRERFPKPLVRVPITPFCSQEGFSLSAPCQDLCISSLGTKTHSFLLGAAGLNVYSWPLAATEPLIDQQPNHMWQFNTPVLQVIESSAGAIAATDHTLYQLPVEHSPQPIATFAESIRIAGYYHRWLIVQQTITPEHFWLVDSLGTVPAIPHPFTVDRFSSNCEGVCLDDRHFMIADVVDHKTCLRLVTRWGKPLGSLELETPVHQLTPSPEPYQFLARGGNKQRDLLIINLKPFRVVRCRLDITAQWIGKLVIGFVGVSADGKLRIVNFQGQIIGQVDQLPPPTAIAFQPPYHLWLATHQGNSPCLHCIDIRKLDLEIVF